MEMLAKFDKNGFRQTTVLEGVHYRSEESRKNYTEQGYLPISEEDFAHYVGWRGTGESGTGYIRDPKTGKPVSAPRAPVVEQAPVEVPVDEERLALYEALAAQEARLVAQGERIAELSAALKGGEGK